MKNREDTKHTTTIHENAFPNDQNFTASELGFDFAFFILQNREIDKGVKSVEFVEIDEVKDYIDVKLKQVETKVVERTRRYEFENEVDYDVCSE